MSLILKSPIIKVLPVKLLQTWLMKGQSKFSLSRLLLGLRYTVQMVRLSVLSPLTDTMSSGSGYGGSLFWLLLSIDVIMGY